MTDRCEPPEELQAWMGGIGSKLMGANGALIGGSA